MMVNFSVDGIRKGKPPSAWYSKGFLPAAVYNDPNRHRTQASILGFQISETHTKKNRKEKGKCYELSKVKRVRSPLGYGTK